MTKVLLQHLLLTLIVPVQSALELPIGNR